MSGEKKAESSFDELLKSLNQVVESTDDMVKALPQQGDDDTVVAAAADSGVEAAGADDGYIDDEEEEDGAQLAKSEAADEFVDATDLLKSLMARQDTTDGTLTKALTGLTGALSKQADLIKSLQSEVAALRHQGRGRKTMLNVVEKLSAGDLVKSSAAEDGKISPSDLLAKSQAAFQAGKLSGVEANTVDVCLRNGWPISPEILTKVALA